MGHDHGKRGRGADNDAGQGLAHGQGAPGKATLVQRRYGAGAPGGRLTPIQRRYGMGSAAPQARSAAPVQAKRSDEDAGHVEELQHASRAPVLQLSDSAIEFPDQKIGTRSEVQVVLVSNRGEEPVSIEEITEAFGDLSIFDIFPPAMPATVPPGGSVPIGVAFHPRQAGKQEALVYVISGSDHAELMLRGHGSESTGDAAERSTTRRQGRNLDEDIANIVGGQPLDGRESPATKSGKIRQIGEHLSLLFTAFRDGVGEAETIIKTIPEPTGRRWSGFLLRLAVEAALVGAAGPVGAIVGRLTLARLANATGLADNLARVTRSVVKMTMLQAVNASGQLRALEKQEGLTPGDGPDPKLLFFREARAALRGAEGKAMGNFIQNIEPVLADADMSYLDELLETFEGLVTSEAVSVAQTTSAVEQWINFLARWDHGTWGSERNLDTLGMKPHELARGVMRVSVVNVGEWWEPNIQVQGISIDGMSEETRAHIRTQVKQVGDLSVTKFINFRGPMSPSLKESKPKGAIYTGRPYGMTHTPPPANTVAAMVIQHMDGSVSLDQTNEAGKAWLAYYSKGFYGSCGPDHVSRSPEEGALELLAVVDVMPLTTLK